jgi:hypothetical protein
MIGETAAVSKKRGTFSEGKREGHFVKKGAFREKRDIS